MALTDESNGSGMIMPVQPMGYGNNYGGNFGVPYAVPVMGGYGYGGGFGNGFGGDWGSLIVLFLFAAMFGGFGGGWGMGGFGGFGGDFAFPWLLASNVNNQNATQDGFNQAATANTLSGLQNAVTSGFGDVQLGIAGVNQNICQSTGQIQNALCNGFAGTTAAVTGAQNAITQQLYNNEINSLNRSFVEQTANTQAINGVSSQLAKCCCDNQLQTESLRATVLQENCEDRNQALLNTRDLLTAGTNNTQAVLDAVRGIQDKLCDQELQAERRENQNLRTELSMRDLAASQAAQTAALVADNTAQTQYIVNRVAPYPIPAYTVANPYGCNGYGYGFNNGFNNGFGFNPFGNVGFGNGSF